jgi:hypothetical protein
MNADVFESWRGRKFVVAESYLHDSTGHLIVLVDVDYWLKNIYELENWCEVNNGQVQGMTVLLNEDQALVSFLLRWS